MTNPINKTLTKVITKEIRNKTGEKSTKILVSSLNKIIFEKIRPFSL